MSYDNKSYGGFNVISTVSPDDYDSYAAEFRGALATGKYDIEKSYLSDTGAYVLYEYGHIYNEDEITAAKFMADSGIIVELGKEGDPDLATSIDKNGYPQFSEGKLSIARLTYEQHTRSDPHENTKIAVSRGLEHCKRKGSQVAVLFDKNGNYNESAIYDGIGHYEKYNSKTHTFKAILVISKDGKVHEWTHNKGIKK